MRDAEDALHYLDGTRLHGRELEIQYAEGDRKSKSIGYMYLCPEVFTCAYNSTTANEEKGRWWQLQGEVICVTLCIAL